MSLPIEKNIQLCFRESLNEDEFINSELITIELEEMNENTTLQSVDLLEPKEIYENDQPINKRTHEDFDVIANKKMSVKSKTNLVENPELNQIMENLNVDQTSDQNSVIITKVQCSLCQKTFLRDNLQDHLRKEHPNNKNIECALCEYKCDISDALRSHLIKEHQDPLESTCDLCNRNFKDIESHVKYFHSMILIYNCTYCEKEFQSNFLLENHVTLFHQGNKVNCPECNKSISRENFTRHRKEKHERIRTPCPYCKEKFAMSNLSRHIRSVHENERDNCPECGKSFSVSNLNKHIKNVHQRLLKTCDICKGTVPASSMSYHTRKFHNAY